MAKVSITYGTYTKEFLEDVVKLTMGYLYYLQF